MADYIDREKLQNKLSESLDEARKVPSQAQWKTGLLRAMFLLRSMPSVDAIEVVRCKDCKWCEERKTANHLPFLYCNKHNCSVMEHFYCIWGERMSNDYDTEIEKMLNDYELAPVYSDDCEIKKLSKLKIFLQDGKFSFWILLVNSITLAINTAMLIIMLRR